MRANPVEGSWFADPGGAILPAAIMMVMKRATPKSRSQIVPP
jgi:hypothetical protein